MNAGESPISIDLAREEDFRLGPLDVRPSLREIQVAERREVLEPRVMQVLVALARRRGAVVSRDELISACWGGRVVGDDAIQRAVAGVRRVGEANGAFAVETVARVGYRLSEADAAEGVNPQRSGRRRLLIVAAMAALAVAVGAALLWPRMAASPAASSARVAVLPFQTLGPSRDTASFADGLLDEILSVLSANQATAVSRTASTALRTPDASAIRKLGASLLLDGTVESAGERIKVRVHLDDAATRTILWSEQFDGPTSDPEPLQAEVAAKATRLAAYALEAKSAGLSNDVLADYITASERFRFNWNGGGQTAEPLLRRVTERAPKFAGGHGDLAAILMFGSLSPGNPRGAEQRAEAVREARRALALDPGGHGAWAILAMDRPTLDWQGREAIWEKGLEFDRAYAGIPYLLGGYLSQTGRLQAAVDMARRGVALDPLWPGPTWSLGLRQLDSSRPGDGLATFDRMAELWPRHDATRIGRFWAHAMYGDPTAALALLTDPRAAPPDLTARSIVLWRQFLMALRSDTPAGRVRAAAALKAAGLAGGITDGPLLAMLARLGDTEGAFAVADRYVAKYGTYDADGLNDQTGPAFLFIAATAPMRRDPRFMPLVSKLKLPQYWLASGHWPDFCAEPGLPYDCRAEAAKAAARP